MTDLQRSFSDLVIANRILAHQGVVDAYGHVSMRHPTDPNRYLLSRSRSPELVEASDILEFSLDGKVLHMLPNAQQRTVRAPDKAITPFHHRAGRQRGETGLSAGVSKHPRAEG